MSAPLVDRSMRWPRRCRRERAAARCRRTCPGFRSTPAPSQPGEAFFALKDEPRRPRLRRGGAEGRRRPRGRRRRQARSIRQGCAAAGRARRAGRPDRAGARPRARARTAKFIGVTGSVGKTGTKEALRLALSTRRRDPCLGRLLQQSLGRAAVARPLPARRALRRSRNGHEPCRRDRAADQAGAPACRDHHHGRAGASGILPVGRGHRRRQGGDLPGHRAGRRRGHQSRQSAFRAACSAGREGGRRQPHRLVRRARQGRRAAFQVRAAAGLLDRAGAHPRRRRHLQARRARPPCGVQLARGAGCGARSPAPISRWRRWRSPILQPPAGPRRADRRSNCRAARRS